MSQQDDFTTTLKTERLNELAFSFKKTGAMVLALELELFSRIDEGHRTVSDIATALDLDVEMVERLVSVCKALDPAFVNLARARNGHYTGRVQSGREFKEFFEEAGFKDANAEWLMRHQLGFIYASKAA